jgi:hypothetical protein
MPRPAVATAAVVVVLAAALAERAPAVPVVPQGFTLEAVSTQLPDSGVTLAIAGPSFGAFGGSYFVASYRLGKIWRLDAGGVPHEFASGLDLPSYLRFGPGGSWGTDLYVSDNLSGPGSDMGDVRRYDASGGSTVLGFPTPQGWLFGGGDIAFADGGAYGQNLYVGISGGTAGDCVSRFVPGTGAFLLTNFPGVPGVGYLGFVAGLEFGPATGGWTAELYGALNDTYSVPRPAGIPAGGIYSMAPDGTPTAIVTADTDPRVKRLGGIAFGPGGAWGGALYAGAVEGRILAIASDGSVTTFVDQIRQPSSGAGIDLEFDAQGRLCFAEPGTCTLWRLSSPTTGVPAPQAAGLRLAAAPSVAHGSTKLGYSLPVGTSGRIECYDLSGRRVRMWSLAPTAGGIGQQAWDGRDDTGRPVPGGLYFARLVAGREQRVARVLWVR